MNIEIDNRLCRVQGYSCLNCGHGCRSFMVPVGKTEKDRIMALRDWDGPTGVDNQFVELSMPGFEYGAIGKHTDGRCVFLDSDNLCIIHREYNLAAKPVACQLFPFILTPFNGALRVGLRFDCPGVCRANGKKLSDNIPDLKRLAKLIYPDGISQPAFTELLPAIKAHQKLSADDFDLINNTIIETFAKVGPDFSHKLYWLSLFAGHLEKVNFTNLSPNDLPGLISLLSEGTARETEKYKFPANLPTSRARVLFGHYLYLLGRKPEIICLGNTTGFWQRLKTRLNDASQLRQLGKIHGPLPHLHQHWQNIDLSEVEQKFDPLDDKLTELLERYILARLTGLNYCGPNYYRYSMTDGLYSLVLVTCAIVWLARVNAISAHRHHLEYCDLEQALITADSNNGYGTALNSGSAGLRLRYLKDHIPVFISNYI